MSAAPDLPPPLARLAAQPGCVWLEEADVAEFERRAGETVLFFAADPVRVRETLDLAVILPELKRAIARFTPRPFVVGLLGPELAPRHARRYALGRMPALVFLRGGEFLGAIEGLRDWPRYLRESLALLEGPAGPQPAPSIPPSIPIIGPRLKGR